MDSTKDKHKKTSSPPKKIEEVHIQHHNRNKQKKKQQKQQEHQQQQQVNLSRREAGANWQNAIQQKTVQQNKILPSSSDNTKQATNDNGETVIKKTKTRRRNVTKYIAMDCEMVGTGPNGTDDMLARVSIVNRNGDILLDKYVKPREIVTDYRTEVSGIRPKDIENGEDFEKVQDEVVEMLTDKILVGHAIKHDLKVLFIKHPYVLIRDTANYRPLATLVSNGATPSLKRVAKAVLGVDIQTGEHNSVEDARATMQVYNRLSVEWEKYIQKKAAAHHSAKHYRRY